jgi:hypothetical protein
VKDHDALHRQLTPTHITHPFFQAKKAKKEHKEKKERRYATDV